MSNTNKNKRIKVAYKGERKIKKFAFKPSHNKRKINDNADHKISIINKKVIQNARKYPEHSFEYVFFILVETLQALFFTNGVKI